MSRNTIQTKLAQPFVTESGYRFNEPDVAFNTWGELNSSRDNVVLICHALTGNSRADEWFPGLCRGGTDRCGRAVCHLHQCTGQLLWLGGTDLDQSRDRPAMESVVPGSDDP